MTSPRSPDGDRKMVSDSLRVLEQVAARTGTVVYLEPLNRYQDHMINTSPMPAVTSSKTILNMYRLSAISIT